jgi:hypothetical protein
MRRLPEAPSPPAFNAVTKSVRAVCQAGARPKEETARQRGRQAELDHAPIHPYAQHSRWIAGNAHHVEQQDAAVRHQQAHGAAGHRHDQALGHQLAHHPLPPRSDGEPDGDLAAAGAPPGKQQVRHVGARNDQDERHQPHQHLHQRQQLRSLQAAPLEFAADRHAPVAIRLDVLALEGGPDHGQFRLRRFP